MKYWLTSKQSLRGDILLFLLMQVTIGSAQIGEIIGVSNPWTEYVKFLPAVTPLPTMWTEDERVMLVGTSLEVGFALLVAWSQLSWKFSCAATVSSSDC
jgi:hypothetical protein